MCVPLIHGCMASTLGPLDVRPDFHVHKIKVADYPKIRWKIEFVNSYWVLRQLKEHE